MNTKFTQFPFASTLPGTPLGAKDPDRWANVWADVMLDFGAKNDGVTNDSPAIQNAINSVLARGGGTVYFPPSFNSSALFYNLTTPIVFTAAAGNVPIRLVGAPGIDINGSILNGNFPGFVIDHVDGHFQVLREINGLKITNSNSLGSGVRLQNSQTSVINLCTILAPLYGVEMDSNAYCTEIRNSNISATPPSSGTQGNPCSFTASASGNVLSVSAVVSGALYVGSFVQNLGLNITALGSGAGGTGTYILAASASSGSVSMTAYTPAVGIIAGQSAVRNCSITGWDVGVRFSNAGFLISGCRMEVMERAIEVGTDINGVSQGAQGFVIEGCQSERVSVPVYVLNGNAGSISGCTWTGTIAPARQVSAASWTAGTATLTVPSLTTSSPDIRGPWTGGTRNIKIEDVNQPGWATSSFVTGTWIDDTHFSYPLASAPPTYDGSSATFSYEIQYGMLFSTGNALKIDAIAVAISPVEQFGIDLSNANLENAIFSGVQSPSWNLPTSGKASISYVNSNNPSVAMLVRDLPGINQGFGNASGGNIPIVGMQFDVTDSQVPAWTGTVSNCGEPLVTGGGSTNSVRLRCRDAATADSCTINNGSGGSGDILTVGGNITGTFLKGQLIGGPGIFSQTVQITETHAENPSRTGTGGAGTYTVSSNFTITTAQLVMASSWVICG